MAEVVEKEPVKCSCKPCRCMVSGNEAVRKGGKVFCSEACGEQHKTQPGCGHKSCNACGSEAAKDKCACKTCDCVPAGRDAVKKGGKDYCSTPCADGHKKGRGCGHKSCNC